MAILLLFVQAQLVVVKELTLKATKPIVTENISIKDESDKVVLNLSVKNILYFKSEDNYVLLFYKIENKVNKELIRTNLKKLEKELSQLNFVRIHRSYMINSENLISAVRNSKGYQVRLNSPMEIELPVSVSYQNDFEDKVIQKS